MNLTLEVVSGNGSALGTGRRKVFGEMGGRIGRAPDCEWVLPSPERFVSRYHARILFKYGQFLVQTEGGNTVGINNPDALLSLEAPHTLKAGDRLFIDEYEILVSIANDVAHRVPLIVGDPFADDADDGGLIPVNPADGFGTDNLDPLSALKVATPLAISKIPDYQEITGDFLSDAFPPALDARAPAKPEPSPQGAVKPSSTAASQQAELLGNGSGGIPSDPGAWDKTSFAPSPAGVAPRPSSVSAVSEPPRPAPRTPPRGLQPAQPPQPDAAPVQPRVATQRLAASDQTAPSIRASAAVPVPPTAATFDVAAMLKGAGVDPNDVSPETAAILGQILFLAVQGTIDALRARDEVKSQFRLAVTRVRSADNNPLSFAVDAGDAMNSLLSRRNAGFLPPLEAFKRAFDDIRNHQMAMLAGMRAGFEHLMSKFDPDQLREKFDRQAKHAGVFSVVSKPKYWEQYSDYFGELKGDRDDAFRRLFGDEFALAYEKQIELLKRTRDNSGA
jgi:type VI secretion system FHA domain protein